jgi:molybdopterin-guanine dinucleotide biosynthesis protein
LDAARGPQTGDTGIAAKSRMTNGGIFGPKLSGKTTLAKELSRQYWLQEHIRSLVLDPNGEEWGQQAKVFKDSSEEGQALFWETVWKTQHMLIIVDESTQMIARDTELVPAFTRLRHLHHKLLVIGHSGTNLLPIMRQQLDIVYLFRQPESAAKYWSDSFARRELLGASTLNQYEFLQGGTYQPVLRRKLKNV